MNQQLRDRELALVRSCVGNSRLVVITGAAGMGKTWLCDRAASLLESQGALVLSGACPQPWGVPVSYAPFVSAWRTGSEPDGGFVALLDRAARLSDDDPPEVAHAWLCDRILATTARWGETRPVVLIIEDVHWIDPASMALLHALITARAARHLTVVVSARADEAPPLLHELAARPAACRIELGPLPDEAIREIVRLSAAEIVRLSDADSSGRFVEAVVRRAAGNPLYATELARHGREGLPDGLRVLLAQRVRALGDAGVNLVAAAALAGPHAAGGLLAEVLELAGDEFEELARRAVGAGLVTRDPASGVSRPRHPLLGEVACELLAGGAKQLLHKRFAHALSGASSPGAELAAAWHWEQAADPNRALELWVRAGQAARRRHAHAEAADAFERALALYDKLWLGSPAPGGLPDRASLAVATAEALRWAGRPAEAAFLLREALLRVPPENLENRCEILCMLWDCRFIIDSRAAAGETLAEAAALAAGLPSSPLRARLAAAEGSLHMTQGRYALGVEHCHRAVEFLLGVPDPATEAYTLSILGVCLAFTGRAAEAVSTLDRARDLAHRLGSVRELVRAAGNLTFVLANTGQHARAVVVGREALSRLEALGLCGSLGGPLNLNVAVSLLALGRWDDLHAAVERSVDTVPPVKAARMRLCQAEALALRGDPARAVAVLAATDNALVSVLDSPDALFDAERAIPAAVAARASGRYRTAVDICRAALAGAPEALGPIERWRLRAEGLGALADLQTAGGRVNRFADPEPVCRSIHGSLVEVVGDRPEEVALAAVCAAETDRAMGVHNGGLRWRHAALAWERLGMVYHAGYARMREAETLVQARDCAAAVEPLRVALAAAERLGAPPLARAVERVAKQGRISLPALGPALGPPSGQVQVCEPVRLEVLTPREREVLDLVGWGRTNREIAGVLVLSERTVGVHVSRILAKLGAGNRAQAARIARDSAPTKHT